MDRHYHPRQARRGAAASGLLPLGWVSDSIASDIGARGVEPQLGTLATQAVAASFTGRC